VYVVLLVIQTPIRIVVDVMTRQIPKGWNRRNKNRKIGDWFCFLVKGLVFKRLIIKSFVNSVTAVEPGSK